MQNVAWSTKETSVSMVRLRASRTWCKYPGNWVIALSWSSSSLLAPRVQKKERALDFVRINILCFVHMDKKFWIVKGIPNAHPGAFRYLAFLMPFFLNHFNNSIPSSCDCEPPWTHYRLAWYFLSLKEPVEYQYIRQTLGDSIRGTRHSSFRDRGVPHYWRETVELHVN